MCYHCPSISCSQDAIVDQTVCHWLNVSACLGVAPPTVNCAMPRQCQYQSRKYPTGLPLGQSGRDIFLAEVPSSQKTLSYIKLTNKQINKQQKINQDSRPSYMDEHKIIPPRPCPEVHLPENSKFHQKWTISIGHIHRL